MKSPLYIILFVVACSSLAAVNFIDFSEETVELNEPLEQVLYSDIPLESEQQERIYTSVVVDKEELSSPRIQEKILKEQVVAHQQLKNSAEQNRSVNSDYYPQRDDVTEDSITRNKRVVHVAISGNTVSTNNSAQVVSGFNSSSIDIQEAQVQVQQQEQAEIIEQRGPGEGALNPGKKSCPKIIYGGGNSYNVAILKKMGCPKPENYHGQW